MPNGSSVLVHYAGAIHFSPQFHLDNVLYSPMFNMNLISISIVCESLNCHVIFHNKKCLLQDLHSQKMIGLGDQIEGLYRLDLAFSNTASYNNALSINHISTNTNLTIPSSTLWHFRLGHVSHKRLTHMSQLYPTLTLWHFMLPKAYYIIGHVLRPPSRMVGLKGNINTFSM